MPNFKVPYLEKIYADALVKNPDMPCFQQTLLEILLKLQPVFAESQGNLWREQAILPRLIEPERVVHFRVCWLDDHNKPQTTRGYRVQYNSALGAYKGGLRFHPTVNLDVLSFLALEQTFKNALTGLPMGGAKGGAIFDPHGKSDAEIMRFCQSFMSELYRHIGPNRDVPAGDIGVGAREIGYLFGMYKKICNNFEGALTGKGLTYGGSLGRKEATGFGLVYFVEKWLNDRRNTDFRNKTVAVSGSGNVALYAIKKIQELGGKVITASDSDGTVYDEMGIDFPALRELKEIKRGRISEYIEKHPRAIYKEKTKPWELPCDIALPCATQNELDLADAKKLVQNGCFLVAEGANMPTTLSAMHYLAEHKVTLAPGKAANAGGVAVSGLEQSQNAMRLQWTLAETDAKLKEIMNSIYKKLTATAAAYGKPEDLVMGANIAGFLRVAEAMVAQGLV